MTAISNSNLQSILMQAQNEVSQLLSINGQNFGQGAGTFVNSIHTLTQTAEAFAAGDSQQKDAAIQNVVSKLSDLLLNLGTKESQKANKQTNNLTQKIEKADEEASNIYTSVDTQLKSILEKCAQGVVSIQDALKVIEELGGDSGKIQSATEELNAQLQIIEENKSILDNEQDPASRKKALAAILGAVSGINQIVGSISEYKKTLEEQNSKVESAAEDIASLQTETDDILSEGVEDLSEVVSQTQSLKQESVQHQLESSVDTAAGTQQVAIGTAMESSPAAIVTGTTGMKYILSGNDKISAGAILMQSSIQNLSALTQSDAAIGGYMQNFSNYVGGLNSLAEGATALVGEYDTAVNDTIASVGSLDLYETANTQLQEYTKEYMSQFMQSNNIDEMTINGENSQYADAVNSQNEENLTIQKFDFDTSIFTVKK